jgi:hypothetical protein
MSRFDDNMMVDTPDATMGDGLVARCRDAAIAALALADECVTAVQAEQHATFRLMHLDTFEEDPYIFNVAMGRRSVFRRKDKTYPAASGYVVAVETRPMWVTTRFFDVVEQETARLRRYLRDDDWDENTFLTLGGIAAKLGGIKQTSNAIANDILLAIA